jgi:hypothetical protein
MNKELLDSIRHRLHLANMITTFKHNPTTITQPPPLKTMENSKKDTICLSEFQKPAKL